MSTARRLRTAAGPKHHAVTQLDAAVFRAPTTPVLQIVGFNVWKHIVRFSTIQRLSLASASVLQQGPIALYL